jgi:hypothetical protein
MSISDGSASENLYNTYLAGKITIRSIMSYACLAYSLPLKMEVVYSSDMSVNL